ncbi:GspE/PulE family protein [Natranaerobius trueperi]|uniref:Type II secretion system protein GspE n=1 Tax=Natranaerobius trueperi TaxID=759412 RepID=A0A226BYG9_9FIRM|nr:GspE/PulE family protein [Natranaerobius trueperi]OWZ84053.1 type II secretion system protein GspE [Natranaerobius trueperi]
MFRQKKKQLGELLVDTNTITNHQLNKIVEHQHETGKTFRKSIVDLNIISEDELIQVLKSHMGIKYISLQNYYLKKEIVNQIPSYLMKHYQVLPINISGNKLTLAMSDPLNVVAIDNIQMATGLEIEPVIATTKEIEQEITRFFGITEYLEETINQIDSSYDKSKNENSIENIGEDSPVVQVVNSLINQAIKREASDIHIDSTKTSMNVRFRIDGILHDITSPPKHVQDLLISRIKIMGGMDVTKKRTPQDGRCSFNLEGIESDLRISTLPTIFGEKIVIRVLIKNRKYINLDELGFRVQDLDKYIKLLKSSAGMILVTGPTGCGKTTTLYSSLNRINSLEKNIITIEDPVEYQLSRINQVQINEQIELTFTNGLRTILRQDPDIIMIGEIRDIETAQIAIRSAITGHLVLSTLHTDSAINTLTRLIDMGIPSFLIKAFAGGIVSQRLVRIICSTCQEKYTPSKQELEIYKKYSKVQTDVTFYKGRGCKNCENTGYKDRTAVYELLILDNIIIDMLIRGCTKELTDYARTQGFIPLLENAMDKVAKGETTIEEVNRIIF